MKTLILFLILSTGAYAVLTGSTTAEVETGGSDTANGGLFDPSQTAGMLTDLSCTNANTASPVCTSAGYTGGFVAGDVGAWLFINSGTNYKQGWCKIASVSAGAATLTAGVGACVNGIYTSMNSTAGVATVASPTGGTWTLDYSQQTAARITYTDLASAGTGLTVTSALNPFGKQQVGNCLVVTGGTNFNTGRFCIASVSGVTATVLGPSNITTGAGSAGTGGLGGAFASPGAAAALLTTANQKMFIENLGSIYSITSASTNVAGGTFNLSNSASIIGYTSTRVLINTDPAPTLQVNVSSATVTAGASSSLYINLIFDGNSQTSAKFTASGQTIFYGCTIKNFNTASTGTPSIVNSLITANSAVAVVAVLAYAVTVNGNTATALTCSFCIDILSYSNSGGSTDGISFAPSPQNERFASNISTVGNGRDGLRVNSSGAGIIMNLVAQSNSGFGINGNASGLTISYANAFFSNTSGQTSMAAPTGYTVGSITLSGDGFTNTAGNVYIPNATAGAGALLQSAALPNPLPAGLTNTYLDIGAARHQDPVSATVGYPIGQ